MNDELARAVGTRVRFYRTAAHKKQAVVAGLAGITTDYLHKIEHGRKLPTVPVLIALAEVLDVNPGDLLDAGPSTPKRRGTSLQTDDLYRAMTRPTLGAATPVGKLGERVHELWHAWQTSPRRYSELTTDLPELIDATESTTRTTTSSQQRQAHAVAADLYGLARTVTKRVGLTELSLLAADRAIRSAEAADDPIRLAGARWNLAQVQLADRRPAAAEDTAMTALDDLRRAFSSAPPDAIAMSGALLLISAVAAVRNRDPWSGRDRLRRALPLAEHVGDRNVCWTAFGPTNVAMYAVTLEVATGEAAEGLRLASTVDHERSPSIERRVAFLLDRAKGYQQRSYYTSSMNLLEQAYSEAPEDLEFRPAGHHIVRAIIKRGPRAESLRATQLASKIGLPN
ncbi:helix-turn-helix domain-containing protein [Amycolatopsis sp. cmx-11-51]|uniref:helix-turn-helix domain-containing protein n=1 Tax=Amycolatopsis sp. cmx-11-51 TaxID=2785797 RepID=UPI0039E66BB6